MPAHRTRYSVQLVVALPMSVTQWALLTPRLYTGEAKITLGNVGIWSSTSGFSRGGRPLFPKDKMRDLEGYDFKVAALPYSPFVMPNDKTTHGPTRYRGLEIQLLNALAKTGNFTYHYVAPADNQWGRKTKNGTWTGMIGMVGYEKADWAISDITFSPQREEFVDFSDAFIYDASELITPKAQPLPRWFGPVRPFQGDVWVAVGISVVLSAPFLTIIARACRGSWREKYFHSLYNTFFFTLQPVFQRGNKRDPKEDPSRSFTGLWLLFTMIVGIMYSSSLTSFLIAPGFLKPIENLQELVKSNVPWGKVYFGGVQAALLEQTQDPVLVALREGVEWRSSLDEILKDVAKGASATWDNRITTRLKVAVQFTDSSGQPMVHFTGYELLLERIAWPMQSFAPYKKRFDSVIARVVQAGLVEKWLQDLIFEEQGRARADVDADVAEAPEDSSTDSLQVVLSLEHFQGPFFVLFLGFCVGAVVFLGEIVLARYVRGHKGS
ncbi:glutamate receptor ionotropic, delta-1-like [Oratosquilla oratoria]|uniref:glutamate receptor ionotropic, delta-1-like n=1 Tax=Oratosquilla oratoria TaxID=337810 RepID=UPI003F76BF73